MVGSKVNADIMPRHVAFIMDGNRRWAEKNKLKIALGHRSGVGSFECILKCVQTIHGIKEVTAYVFSSENWGRPRSEVEFLLDLLSEKIPKLVKKAVEDKVRVCFVGHLTDGRIPKRLKNAIENAHRQTESFSGLKLNLAFNYGASLDSLHAVQAIVSMVQSGKLSPAKISEHEIRAHLLSSDVRDIDLVIRTGGEVRTSNFFEVQTRYAEWVFLDTLWPDFTPQQFKVCLDEYAKRERRYGGCGKIIPSLHLKD